MSDIPKTIEELRFFKVKLFNGIFSDRIGCFDMAIRLLKELEQRRKSSKWILCSERLPENDKEVIVTVREEDGEGGYEYFVLTTWLQDGVWCIRKNRYHPTVIAWKPLPKPYNRENTNAE